MGKKNRSKKNKAKSTEKPSDAMPVKEEEEGGVQQTESVPNSIPQAEGLPAEHQEQVDSAQDKVEQDKEEEEEGLGEKQGKQEQPESTSVQNQDENQGKLEQPESTTVQDQKGQQKEVQGQQREEVALQEDVNEIPDPISESNPDSPPEQKVVENDATEPKEEQPIAENTEKGVDEVGSVKLPSEQSPLTAETLDVSSPEEEMKEKNKQVGTEKKEDAQVLDKPEQEKAKTVKKPMAKQKVSTALDDFHVPPVQPLEWGFLALSLACSLYAIGA